MNKDVQLVHGEYGLRGIVHSAWSRDMTRYLLDQGVVELELNDGKGWRGDDLAMLVDFPHLKFFKIIDLRISSVEPIHFLHELRTLEVITYCETEIRFNAFPQLENCSLEWRAKASSLFNCTNLKKLFLNSYDGTDVDDLSSLTQLESLAILNAPVQNLLGIRVMELLRSLRLANLKFLNSLAGLERLANLEELDVHTCSSIGSIEQLGGLTRLKKLCLNNCGNISSLKPLENLQDLEEVQFYESTNIVDGDLSPLSRLKKMSKVTFQNRRHYSHRREDFGAAFFRRASVPK